MPPAADPLCKVYLEITTACNLDCAMCIRRVWDSGIESMARPTYETLVADLRAIGGDCTVHFGGFGEPLVHPDFLDYVYQAKAAGLRVEVTTNGVLLAAFFALSNRMANMIGMRPNDEFYLLGRLPREKKAAA